MVEQDLEQVSSQLTGISGFDKFAFQHLLEDTAPLVVLKILARFYISVQEATKTIEDGITKNESIEIWKACHKLTGSAELLGFKEFGQKSRRLDIVLKTMPDIDLHLTEIKDYLLQAKTLNEKIMVSFPQLKNYL
jgi:HPt (histidine-containing phosphotransfer) domain-containing protein